MIGPVTAWRMTASTKLPPGPTTASAKRAAKTSSRSSASSSVGRPEHRDSLSGELVEDGEQAITCGGQGLAKTELD